MIREGTVIFATDDSEEGQSAIRAWVREKAYTAADVRLVKREGQCLAIAKRTL